MTPGKRGADRLVGALHAAGVRRIFTLSGNHVMPVYDATIGSGIELIHVRHEGAAVHMADAYARLTGEIGITLVTGGPGHANAVGALYTAAMAESPMVLLSGHSPHSESGRGAFQEMRQADIAAPLAKASWTVASADELVDDLDEALRIATGGRPGPVHLSLPMDVLEAQSDRKSPDTPHASAHPVLDAAAFVARLRAAQRPLVLCGPASCTRSGRERMAMLEASLGIPVIGMESPRGIADPSLGAFAQVLAQSDCILLLGKKLDFTLKFGRAPAIQPSCAFLQIDADEAEIARTRRAVGELLERSASSPLFDAANALTREALKAGPLRSSWLSEARAALDFRPREWDTASSAVGGRMHPVQALRPLQALLDSHPQSIFVSDGGEFGQWAQACLRAPHRVVNGVAGAIGAALPFAVAARLAQPDAPIVAAMGDGTFGFHAAEIDTAVRYGLPFVAIVGNDARWNAEYQIQLREYGAGRTVGTELLPARYDEVARAFGGFGELVTDPSQVLAAAARAMESKLPSVLNIMIEGLAAPNVKR